MWIIVSTAIFTFFPSLRPFVARSTPGRASLLSVWKFTHALLPPQLFFVLRIVCTYILVEMHKFSKFCLKCVHSCNFNSASLFALGFFSWANTCCYGIWTIYALFFRKTVEWPNAVSNVCQEWKIFGRLFVLCRQAPVRWVVSKVKSWEQLKFCLAHHQSAEERERMNEKFDCEKWTQRVTTRV